MLLQAGLLSTWSLRRYQTQARSLVELRRSPTRSRARWLVRHSGHRGWIRWVRERAHVDSVRQVSAGQKG